MTAPPRPPAGPVVTCRHQPRPHVLNADDRWCHDPVPYVPSAQALAVFEIDNFGDCDD